MATRHLDTLRSWAAYGSVPLVGLVTAPLLARALGPEGRGQLAAILQPLTVADAVAAVGVPAAVTYFVARGASGYELRLHAAKILAVSVVVVSGVLVWYSSVVAATIELDRWFILAIWSSLIAGVVIAYRRSVWQGLGSFGRLDFDRAASATLRLIVIVLLCLIGGLGTVAFAAAYVGSGLLASGAVLMRKLPPVPSRSFLNVPFDGFLRFSVLSSLGTIAIALNNRLDQAVLPATMSASELGFYSVAVTVAEVPLLICVVMSRDLLVHRSRGESIRQARGTVLTGIAGVAALVAVAWPLLPSLVPLFFGESFVPAIAPMRILLLATIFGTAAVAGAVWLTGGGSAGLGAIGPAAGVVVTVALLAFFWTGLNASTAAWISVASQASAAGAAIVTVGVQKSRREK